MSWLSSDANVAGSDQFQSHESAEWVCLHCYVGFGSRIAGLLSCAINEDPRLALREIALSWACSQAVRQGKEPKRLQKSAEILKVSAADVGEFWICDKSILMTTDSWIARGPTI